MSDLFVSRATVYNPPFSPTHMKQSLLILNAQSTNQNIFEAVEPNLWSDKCASKFKRQTQCAHSESHMCMPSSRNKNSNDILHCNKGAISKNYFPTKRIEAPDILYNFFQSFYNWLSKGMLRLICFSCPRIETDYEILQSRKAQSIDY